jgi:ATP/ADP translocase
MTDVFNTDQGKRLFGFISVGGSLGGILGGTITASLDGLLLRWPAECLEQADQRFYRPPAKRFENLIFAARGGK